MKTERHAVEEVFVYWIHKSVRTCSSWLCSSRPIQRWQWRRQLDTIHWLRLRQYCLSLKQTHIVM